MCGIAGGWGAPDPARVTSMLSVLAHRGPDGQGLCTAGGICLGHDRLSIIDLATGRQPLANEAGSLHLVANGEIYNYRELRAELEARGHAFRSQSDSEVILHLYEEEGPACVRRLDGMFAFAIGGEGKLFLARDPLGIKPLYVVESHQGPAGHGGYFASEIKALQGVAGGAVQEFPPGSYRLVELDGSSRTARYYQLPPARGDIRRPAEAVEELGNRLAAAVAKRLVADVPVGVFLSGGLDSSLLAALACRQVAGPLPSFAVGLAGARDVEYSRLVARHLGTQHHVYEYTPREVEEALPEVVYHLESFDPALVRSAIPTYFVSRLARDHVKVVLTGEGADELFAGYDYLKGLDPEEELTPELRAVTAALHNTNLQRVDRMTMAHGLEARVPFLDLRLVEWAFRLPPFMKLHGPARVEKWVLRRLGEGLLPRAVLERRKVKFSHGTGSAAVLRRLAEARVTDRDLAAARRTSPVPLESREAVLYYRIFREFFPGADTARLVGRTRSVVAGEIA